jgi:hypothetical protein
LDCESSVDMDLFIRERTDCLLLETGGIVDLDQDFVSNFIVLIDSMTFFCDKCSSQ